jgi:hypothetical protein
MSIGSSWLTGTQDCALAQGFDRRGSHADDGYPSGARVEKSTGVIPFAWPPLLSAPSQLIEP